MAASAARSVFRSFPSVRSAAAKIAAAGPRTARSSPLGLPRRRPAAPRILRSPLEMSFCVESLLPVHSVTASAMMTSMLSFSHRGYGLLSGAGNDDM